MARWRRLYRLVGLVGVHAIRRTSDDSADHRHGAHPCAGGEHVAVAGLVQQSSRVQAAHGRARVVCAVDLALQVCDCPDPLAVHVIGRKGASK